MSTLPTPLEEAASSVARTKENLEQTGDRNARIAAGYEKCIAEVQRLKTRLDEVVKSNPESFESLFDVRLIRNSAGNVGRNENNQITGYYRELWGLSYGLTADGDLQNLRDTVVRDKKNICIDARERSR